MGISIALVLAYSYLYAGYRISLFFFGNVKLWESGEWFVNLMTILFWPVIVLVFGFSIAFGERDSSS